jgi:hypothetical protein
MVSQLVDSGASAKEARQILPRLHLGGKALFTGTDQDPYAVEMTGPGKWDIFAVQEGGHPTKPSSPNEPPPRQ